MKFVSMLEYNEQVLVKILSNDALLLHPSEQILDNNLTCISADDGNMLLLPNE